MNKEFFDLIPSAIKDHITEDMDAYAAAASKKSKSPVTIDQLLHSLAMIERMTTEGTGRPSAFGIMMNSEPLFEPLRDQYNRHLYGNVGPIRPKELMAAGIYDGHSSKKGIKPKPNKRKRRKKK